MSLPIFYSINIAATDSVSLLSWKNDDNLGTIWKISKATDQTVVTGECFTSENSSWSGFVAIPMCTGIGYLNIFDKFNAEDTCAEIYFPYI